MPQALFHNPFLTDGELGVRFGVSIPTIRLDRRALAIPELKERTRAVANDAYQELRALAGREIIGELKALVVGQYGRSELLITQDMILTKARVARGHQLFAQANSLASALVNADMALTGSAQLKFLRPVRQDEWVEMEGQVVKRHENRYEIDISGKVRGQKVIQGQWIMFGLAE